MLIKKGLEFEDMLLAKLEQYPGYAYSTVEQDHICGADLYWYGLPIDVSLNSNKPYVENVASIELAASTCMIGIRRRNKRVVYKDPVLVLTFATKVASFNSVIYDVDDKLIEDAISLFWNHLED